MTVSITPSEYLFQADLSLYSFSVFQWKCDIYCQKTQTVCFKIKSIIIICVKNTQERLKPWCCNPFYYSLKYRFFCYIAVRLLRLDSRGSKARPIRSQMLRFFQRALVKMSSGCTARWNVTYSGGAPTLYPIVRLHTEGG